MLQKQKEATEKKRQQEIQKVNKIKNGIIKKKISQVIQYNSLFIFNKTGCKRRSKQKARRNKS